MLSCYDSVPNKYNRDLAKCQCCLQIQSSPYFCISVPFDHRYHCKETDKCIFGLRTAAKHCMLAARCVWSKQKNNPWPHTSVNRHGKGNHSQSETLQISHSRTSEATDLDIDIAARIFIDSNNAHATLEDPVHALSLDGTPVGKGAVIH